MSNKALTWVFEQSKSKGSARLMLVAIADACDDDGKCMNGVKKFAKKCNVTVRQAQRLIGNLEKLGEVVVEPNVGFKTASGWTNRYSIPAVATMKVTNARPVVRKAKSKEVTETSPLKVPEVSPLEKEEKPEMSPHGVSGVSPDEVSELSPNPSVYPSVYPIHIAPDGATGTPAAVEEAVQSPATIAQTDEDTPKPQTPKAPPDVLAATMDALRFGSSTPYSLLWRYVHFLMGTAKKARGEWREFAVSPGMALDEVRAFGSWLADVHGDLEPLRKPETITDYVARFRDHAEHGDYLRRAQRRHESVAPIAVAPEPVTQSVVIEDKARADALVESVVTALRGEAVPA